MTPSGFKVKDFPFCLDSFLLLHRAPVGPTLPTYLPTYLMVQDLKSFRHTSLDTFEAQI